MDELHQTDFLRAFPSARALEAQALKDLLNVGVPSQVLEDSVLFDTGDPSHCAYLLVHGRIRVERQLESGERITLGRLSRGHVVGDMGLLSGEPRSAAAVAESDALALRLDLEAYERLRDGAHPAAFWLLEEIHMRMSERITSSYDRVVRLDQEPELASELPNDPIPPPSFIQRLLDRARR